MTPPAPAVAEPDRDLAAAQAAHTASAGAQITVVLIACLTLTALALALFAPRPVDPVTGAPALTAVQLLAVPALVLAAAWLTERLHRFTR